MRANRQLGDDTVRTRWSLLAACLLFLNTCDGGGSSGADSSGDSRPASTTTYTDWSPDATTSKKPAYDNACRLRVADQRELASTGETDDSLKLTGTGTGDAQLVVAAFHNGIHVLDAVVDLDAVRAGQSWGRAKGTATWTGDAPFSGQVVDGTICFQAPLAVGQSGKGEFSLIVAVEGHYVSVGGDFALTPNDVKNLTPVTVRADPVELDLQ